jgi:hypothetical protein
MTQQFDNTNRGALFKNDRKEQPNHPDYKGSLNVNGVDYWVSSWIKEGAKGKFMSLSVTPKEQQAAPAPSPKRDMRPAAAPASAGFDDIDDSDLPF